MKSADAELLRRVESLLHKLRKLCDTETDPAKKANLDLGLKGISRLASMTLEGKNCFTVEPWHIIHDDVPFDAPGEMLLRLKDAQGQPIPPYPVVMAFYGNGLTAELDTILILSAIGEFMKGEERQVSVNISARSLRNADFVKMIHSRVESLKLEPGRKIIFEIHESTPNLTMSKEVLKIFRTAHIGFAIDDVGLSMNDVMRMAEFETIADVIKLDRQSVNANPESPNSLDHVISFISALFPNAVLVAEGVKSAAHAMQLRQFHPDIKYVQGLYLPDRETFAREFAEQPEILPATQGILRPA
jgi:EAL domain-containing protein (putative c-di-GMP-specific phosphodiesterase class I)